MVLNPIFAQQIADRVSSSIGHNINIFDLNGCIIGSTENKRVNDYHEGAHLAIKTSKNVVITKFNNKSYKGAQPGINLPLEQNGQIIGCVGISGQLENIETLAKITKMTIESMIQNSLTEQQSRSESKAKEIFVHNLLYSETSDYDTHIRQQASFLGFDLSIPKIAMVVYIKNFETKNKSRKYIEKILHQIDNAVDCNLHCLSTYIGDSKFVIFTDNNNQNSPSHKRLILERIGNHIISQLKTLFALQSVVSIGAIEKQDSTLKSTFQEALETLDIGLLNQSENILFTDDLGLELIISNVPQQVTKYYVTNVLSNKANSLTEVLDETLIHTLEIFFESNLNVSETARLLYIHRNTLLYRLDKALKVTNKDPRIFADAVELKFLLMLSKATGKVAFKEAVPQ